MNRFKAPADAADWSRRDFMRNGFTRSRWSARSPRTSSLKGDDGHDVGRTPRRRRPSRSRRSRGTCRSRRRSSPTSTTPGRRRLRRGHQGRPGGDPAGLRDADLRLRGRLPRADDPRPQGPPDDRAPEEPPGRSTRTCTCTAATCPAAHDGHPMDVIQPGKGFDYTYPNEQDAAFLWYHDHAHGRTAQTLYYGLAGMYLLADEREDELGLPTGPSTTSRSCWPTTRSTRTARSATRRTSTSASAATRSSSTARCRRGWPSSAGSTGCAS